VLPDQPLPRLPFALLKASRIPVVGNPPDGVRDGVDVGGRVEVGDDVEVDGRVGVGPVGDAVAVAVGVGGSGVAVGEGVDVIVGGVAVDVGVGVGPTVPKASDINHTGGLPFGGTSPPPSWSVPLQEAGPSSVSVVPSPFDMA
jgi:hypothetical protein